MVHFNEGKLICYSSQKVVCVFTVFQNPIYFLRYYPCKSTFFPKLIFFVYASSKFILYRDSPRHFKLITNQRTLFCDNERTDFRCVYFQHLLKSFEPRWPMNIKYAISASLYYYYLVLVIKTCERMR